MNLVSIKNLTRTFDVSKPWLNRLLERLPKRKLTAVSDVSFEIKAGSTYALVGESGSGKSTIGKMLVGLLSPSSGSIKISGIQLSESTDKKSMEELRNNVQMIFQDPYASLNPRWRVRNIIAEPVIARKGTIGEIVEQRLLQVGLAVEDANKFPHEFSGGQRQRIGVARALSSEPKLIICDEPTSALDVSVQAQVLNLMSDLRDKFGLTYLFISHDLAVVRHMANRIGVLYLGRLLEEADTNDLFEAPKHPYTRMLLEAAPRIDRFGHDAELPAGEIPDPINPPSGCAFHPRCPIASEVCSTKSPELRNIGQTRVACHHASDL